MLVYQRCAHKKWPHTKVDVVWHPKGHQISIQNCRATDSPKKQICFSILKKFSEIYWPLVRICCVFFKSKNRPIFLIKMRFFNIFVDQFYKISTTVRFYVCSCKKYGILLCQLDSWLLGCPQFDNNFKKVYSMISFWWYTLR